MNIPHHPTARGPFAILLSLFLFVILFGAGPPAFAQADQSTAARDLYSRIKSAPLSAPVTVNALELKRDRAQMTFTGTFYFAAPVDGRVTGAVFVGDGKMRVEVPPSDFEKENVRRLLGVDVIEADFKTAVFKFSDDTFERLGQSAPSAGTAEAAIQKMASEMEPRILKETGANLSARVALSILNQEKPGFFFGTFDGGKRRFSFVLDYQNRIPVANFDINAGEKGLIFHYDAPIKNNEIWMAFYALEDYQRNAVGYSDLDDLVDVQHYNLDLDLVDHKRNLRLIARMQAETRSGNIRAIPFQIGEDLGEDESIRLKKNLRLKRAKLGGTEISFAQEDWEGGFTVFLPAAVEARKKLELDLTFEADFMHDGQKFIDRNYPTFIAPNSVVETYYPRSTTSWYPRHGYLDRATFDLTFHHPKK